MTYRRLPLSALAAFATLLLSTHAPLHAGEAEISIDGEVLDWKGIAATAMDPAEGAQPVDWRKLFLAHDKDALFLRYTTEGAVDFNKGAAYMVFLDTDQSARTGFQGDSGQFPLGADYLLQGLTLYRYSGTGADWTWESLGTISGAAKGNEAEFAIPREQLGDAAEVDLMLYADNVAEGVGGEVLDLLPDDALTNSSSKISYSLK